MRMLDLDKILMLLFSVFILSGCTGNIVTGMPISQQPQTQEEFDAEALLISLEDRIMLEDAQISLARVYTDFQDEEPGFLAPPPRYVNFINCTSNTGPTDFETVGRTTVVYRYGGRTIQRTFRDACNDHTRTMTKHFCSGDRLSIIRHRCSHGCWMGEHCK